MANLGLEKVSKFKRKDSEFNDKPRIDPKSIVLEMDLLDKSKLDQEDTSNNDPNSLANLKTRDNRARDLSD